jgi:integrase
MASIVSDPNGYKRILFHNKDNRRKPIYLGKCSMHYAERIKTRVELLNNAICSSQPLDLDTAKWVGDISDALHKKLAKAGLVTPREKAKAGEPKRLGEFIDGYIAGRTDAKRMTIVNLTMFRNRLTAFFGAEREIASIKRSDADAFAVNLKTMYAPATFGRTIKGCRQLFMAACRADIITRNPFDGIKAGSHTDKDRQRFIPRADIDRLIEACPDAEWRLIVALSRYGGLRCPSEHMALTRADVDWARDRFRCIATVIFPHPPTVIFPQ